MSSSKPNPSKPNPPIASESEARESEARESEASESEAHDFAAIISSKTVIDHSPLNLLSGQTMDDVASSTQLALQNPIDFPSLVDAVVPGDHVVLALDPNVPQIQQVVAGVIQAISETDASHVDIVLWDEASDAVVEAVTAEVAPSSRVARHQGDRRPDVRYLAADDAADPIYVNRLLVDADLVLPVVAARFPSTTASQGESNQPGDKAKQDPTGIYPQLIDSGSRKRYSDATDHDIQAHQTSWLLGVQMYLCVVPNGIGGVQHVLAGTIIGVDEKLGQLAMDSGQSAKSELDADLVVAVVDGDESVQNWQNAVRAAKAATKFAATDATIVVWTDLSEPIPIAAKVSDFDGNFDGNVDGNTDEDFPRWNGDARMAETLADLAMDYRLVFRCRIDAERIEEAGFGVIETAEQLQRLSAGFSAIRLLRGAQFLSPAACSMTANTGVSATESPES